MTDQGEVWSAGVNISGQFGDKTTNDYYNPTPIKFVLPTGVTAKDIFESSMGRTANGQNIFVIGSNGKVYGAGHNGYGQLGNGAFQYDAIKNTSRNDCHQWYGYYRFTSPVWLWDDSHLYN